MQEEAAKPFFALKTVEGVPTMVPNRARSIARPFPLAKKPGETRVFVVGESVAERLPPDLLAESLGGGSVRVVNCGMGAYDSVYAADVVDEARPLRAGPCDRAGREQQRRRAGLACGVRALPGRNLALRRLWSWRLAQDWALGAFSRPPDRAARTARFERGLGRMLRAARRARACAPSSRPCPSTSATFIRRRASSRSTVLDSPRAGSRWSAGARARRRRRSAPTRPRNPGDAICPLWRAGAQPSANRTARPQEYDAAVEASDLDRCAPSRNGLIRRVAAKGRRGRGGPPGTVPPARAARRPGLGVVRGRRALAKGAGRRRRADAGPRGQARR